jgi:hypothetical protein
MVLYVLCCQVGEYWYKITVLPDPTNSGSPLQIAPILRMKHIHNINKILKIIIITKITA